MPMLASLTFTLYQAATTDLSSDDALHITPLELRARVSYFLKQTEAQFRRRPVTPNLSPLQNKLLQDLRASKDFTVVPSDQNLGPCILEKDTYVRRVFKDHLSDETTYRRLTLADARKHMGFLKSSILDFI